jgi:hypothetical protein
MDLSWAFPDPSPDFPPEDKNAVKHVPGSSKSYTQGQIDDIYNPPDWFPEEHMPYPKVVARGEGTATPGCAACHLASGSVHPESANLTGLTADYLLTQMHDFQQGRRTDPRHRMSEIAKGMTEDESKEASAYFASLKPLHWIRVVETDMVPETYLNEGRLRIRRASRREIRTSDLSRTCRRAAWRGARNWPKQAARERRLRASPATARRSWASDRSRESRGIRRTTLLGNSPGFRSARVTATWIN